MAALRHTYPSFNYYKTTNALLNLESRCHCSSLLLLPGSTWVFSGRQTRININN